MIIRNASSSDKTQLLGLLNGFSDYNLKNSYFSSDLAPFEEFKDRNKTFELVVTKYLNDENFFTFVAEESNNLVGYICGYIEERPSRVLDKKGVIEDWFVVDQFRGEKIGEQLLTALTTKFKQENCTHLGVSIYASNKDTLDIYHHLGFIDSDLSLVRIID